MQNYISLLLWNGFPMLQKGATMTLPGKNDKKGYNRSLQKKQAQQITLQHAAERGQIIKTNSRKNHNLIS